MRDNEKVRKEVAAYLQFVAGQVEAGNVTGFELTWPDAGDEKSVRALIRVPGYMEEIEVNLGALLDLRR